MAKLMGLDYVIQFRKEKENVATNALSCYHEEIISVSISVVILDWLQEVTNSYQQEEMTKRLLE